MKNLRIVLISISIILLCAICMFAQGPDTLWTKTYGGANDDKGYSVEQTFDGGYIICGYTKSFGAGDADVYLIKTDSIGDTLWTRTYGSAYFDAGYSVQQTSDSGFIVAGVKTIPDSTWTLDYGYLIKTDKNGDSLWAKIYGWYLYNHGRFYSVDKTNDGGYIATGYIMTGLAERDMSLIVVKTDMDGNVLWHKEYTEGCGYAVKQTTEGEYIVTGATSFGGANVYLLKTYSNGDTIWTRNYGGPDEDQGYSLQSPTDNGYIVVGETFSYGAGWADVYLIKTDSLGDTLWTRTYGGTDYDGGFSVQKTYDSNYIITGYTKSFGSGLADVYLIKVDENGDTLRTMAYGWAEADIGYCLQQTTDSGYIITGYTKSFGTGDWDVLLVKTQSDVGIEEKDTRNVTYNPKFRIYPNPFSKLSTISYQLPMKGNVTLRVYDLSGRLVRLLLSGEQGSGYYEVAWDGSNGNGIKVSRGIYFVRLEVGEYTETKKIIKIH